MKKCVFLTLSEVGNYVIDDELAYPALARRGWEVVAIPWDSVSTDWSQFDLAVIRSTWDYQLHPARFLSTLRRIEAATRLENPAHVVAWNMQKTYLADLQAAGVPVVPSIFYDRLEENTLPALFDQHHSDRIVIKPQLGATASGAFRLHRGDIGGKQEEIEAYYHDTPLLVQPYLPAIETEGEYSLFYFNNAYSHAILKTPIAGDFRSQEEHGARILPVVEPSAALLEAGFLALQAAGQRLLYARADFVCDQQDQFRLMELELVEPALYFRTCSNAPDAFASAVDSLFEE